MHVHKVDFMETKNIQLMKTKRAGAFTLIELLVVIAIMGIIAGLLVNLAGKASNSKKKARVSTELQQLKTVIDAFQQGKGFYPPSNGNTNNVSTNQLYYELTGTIYKPNEKEYQTVNGELITVKTIQDFFNAGGLVNSGGDAKNFFTGLKSSQYGELSADPSVKILVVPVEGPNDIDVNGRKLNPWRYNSSTPTNNPGSYDLWAEILIGGKTVIIGNWKE